MPRRSPRLLPLLVLLLPACGQDVTQAPLASASVVATTAPPAGTRLIFASNGYTDVATGLRDVFGEADGAFTRLTFCNGQASACDQVAAAPAPDGKRIVVRRLLEGGQGPSLVFVDLARGLESELLPITAVVSGADWSPTADLVVFSGRGVSGLDDLWRLDIALDPANPANPHGVTNLSATGDVAERHPRFDPAGQVAVYERGAESGKSEIWIFQNQATQSRVTQGGPGADPLPGSPYLVGSDADPAFSPDGNFVVFRRLTGTTLSAGTWDVVSVGLTADRPLRVIASGPAWRGAPDWGADGITFVEQDASGAPRLVLVQPDGSGRRELVALDAGGLLSNPRWLR